MKKIFLLGNSNVGKTSLFNLLTGSRENTANYIGTTVDIKQCISKNFQGHHFEVFDIPGVYSFSSKKGEECIAWKKIEDAMEEENAIFLQVINAGQWRKSLFLTLDLQKKGIFPVLFFNTKKGEENLGEDFYSALEKEFSLPVFTGNIEGKNFFECFWGKFFLALSRVSQKTLPKMFSSEEDQHHYIEKIFQKFSREKISAEKKESSIWRNFLDRVFLHSFFGILIFFLFLYGIFEMTFTFGNFPMNWIDSGIISLQEFLRNFLGEGIISSFLIDGIVSGVGGTLIFLPNIFLLFFFLSLLQESGYLARTSFLFDIFFQKLGISGKASIPLLMGFGCNVPSIMAIKTFESKKEQIIVAMMTLFMSCGARLPVYTLLISTFIPEHFRGISLFGIYLLGIFVSFGTGKILSIVYKKRQKNKLMVYEMPKLILPSLKKAFLYAQEKGKNFAVNVGKFIVPVSVVLWILFTFPQEEVKNFGIEKSYGAEIGKTIQPIFEPMGFDWKSTTALLSGIAAKEVIVTTFAQLYHSKDETESLQENIKNSGNFSLPTAIAFLIFTLLYTPCLAVIGVINKELGRNWAFFALLYPTSIAWVFAFIGFLITNFFLSS